MDGGVNDRKFADDDEVPPDFPPESFCLSKDAESDWFDRNAFFGRNESTRANSNSNQHINANPSAVNSHRFSVTVKSKASVIRLPKTQKTAFVESKRRRYCTKPASVRLFPNRSGSSAAKAAVAEPGSPKVSCMGRVRSKRGRRRSNSVKRNEKLAEKIKTGFRLKVMKIKTGFRSKVISLFLSRKGQKKNSRSASGRVMEIVMEERVDVNKHEKSVSVKMLEVLAATAEAPGLGGLTKFSSGRRN